MQAPCKFVDIEPHENDPMAIMTVAKNNQCSREIRLLHIELQRFVTEQNDAFNGR